MKEYRNEDGEYHQINAPAIEYSDGDYDWRFNGNKHRYYGPACYRHNGIAWHYDIVYEYWIFGVRIK